MKRTITVNLGSILLVLDEDAYYLLDGFLRQESQKQSQRIDKESYLISLEKEIALQLKENCPQPENCSINKSVVEKTLEKYNYSSYTAYNQPYNEPSRSRNQKKLFRVMNEKVIAGVCSGLAKYFDIEVWIFRVIFLITFFGYGTGLLVYLILWIAMPKEKKAL